MYRRRAAAVQLFAVFLLVLLILSLLLILLLLLVLLVLLVLLLLLVLIIAIFHFENPPENLSDISAQLVCPDPAYLSRDGKISAASRAKNTAAVIPPAVAFRPPVRTPRSPWVSTASRTPLASR